MREKIIEVLDSIDKAIDIIEINELLKLKSTDELNELNECLEELIKEGIIHITKKNRYILLKNCKSLKTGNIDMASSGFAFCVIENEDDIFISKNNLNGAIEGDQVVIDIYTYHGKKEGKVIKIINRNLKNLVGRIAIIKGKISIILEDKKLNLNIVLKEEYPNLVDGHIVLIKLGSKIKNNNYIATVEKIIGHINDPDIDILTIAYSHGIFLDFSEETKEELKAIPSEVTEKEKAGRRDLTNEMIFTIDGDDTKDIDDAISISFNDGIYTLGVHIADVTNYVKPNTALYKDAYSKGTSSYLADRV